MITRHHYDQVLSTGGNNYTRTSNMTNSDWHTYRASAQFYIRDAAGPLALPLYLTLPRVAMS